MGFYSKHIFPRLLEWTLGNSMISEQRRTLLSPLEGRVLEIGFGTGLNLPFYPRQVTSVTGLDTEQMLPERVAERIARASMPVEQFQLDAAGSLPFNDEAFDNVVSTF